MVRDGCSLGDMYIYIWIHSEEPTPTSPPPHQTNFNSHPAPPSSPLPPKIPPKSTLSPPALSPLLGALGLATLLLLLRSCPALLGNVGNMAVLLGFGSSLKYACASTSDAVGRSDGFRERREVRRVVPARVRKGNLARMTVPVVRGLGGGRRRDLALGRRLKPGQVVGVGMPVSSKIWEGGGLVGMLGRFLGGKKDGWAGEMGRLPLRAGRLRFCLGVRALWLGVRRRCSRRSTCRRRRRISRRLGGVRARGTIM